MDGDGLWGRNMGVEGEGRNGEITRKISEMGVRGGGRDAGVYGKGGVAEGKVEREGRYGGGEGSDIARICMEKIKGKIEIRKGLSKWERERKGY